jgi:mannose/fructose-specific phosphotransferase system component IIA
MTGHRVLVGLGVLFLIATLGAAGFTQASNLLDAKVAFGDITSNLRLPLLLNTAAHGILVTANLLLVVNFFRTGCNWCVCSTAPKAESNFRQPSKLEAHAS